MFIYSRFIFMGLSCLSLISCGSDSGNMPPLIVPVVDTPADQHIYISLNGNDQTGDGSQASPWASVQYAINSVSYGSTIYVQAGVYAQKIKISDAAHSGIEGKPITIIGVDAILDGSGLTPADDDGMITIENASHIIISGFEIRNYKTQVGFSHEATPSGIVIRGSGQNIELRNNKIHSIEDNSTCTQNDDDCHSGANGIGVFGTTTQGLTNIRIIDNEIYNNILGASESLTINGNVDGFEITGNSVHDNNNIGFDFIGGEDDICAECSAEQNRVRNGIVRGNRAENNSIIRFGANPWYAGEDGNAAGFYVDGAHHILLEANISTGNDLGFEIASENPGVGSDDIIVSSNLIYNNYELGIVLGGYAQSASGEGGGSANRIHVVNNTLYHNNGHSSEITLNYRVHDLTFTNNIIFGRTSVDEVFEAPDVNGQSSDLRWNHNLWWANMARHNVPVPDLDPMIADPKFIDIENRNAGLATGSSAIDAGVLVGAITDWSGSFWQRHFPSGSIPVHGTVDVTQNSRTQTVLDMGATEQ